jgi:amino acid permease
MIAPPSSSGSRSTGVSITEATVAIAKTCIGGGVLALPYAHLQGGVLAVPAMCLLGLWNWITSNQLLNAYEALSGSEIGTLTGYSAVVHAALGHSGVLLFDTMICMLLTGVCSSIQVQVAHLVEPYVALPFGDVYSMLVLLIAVCLVPLALMRNLSRLAIVSAVALVVLAVGLLAVATSGVVRFGVPPLPQRLLTPPDLSGVASFFSIAAFSFGMQTNLLPVRGGMREPHRAPEVVSFALVVVVCVNSGVGVGLAWLYAGGGRAVEENILLNLPPHTLLSICVQLSTAVVSVLGYPLLMLPVMQLLPARLPPAWHGSGLRLGFLACTTVLALLLREFALVLSLCGCLTIFVCLVLPPLCHLRLCSWPRADRPPTPSAGTGTGTGAADEPKRQPVVAALDAAIFIGGACAFIYFSAVAIEKAFQVLLH